MVQLSNRVVGFLDERNVSYKLIHHRVDFTAQETAADTATKGREFAKTIVLRADGGFVLAVLPAHHRIDVDKMRAAMEAKDLRLATEAEMRELFPDCEVGAEPCFGNLYGVPVYVSVAMSGDEHITFNAGTHEDAIRLRFRDFLELVRPRTADISWKP